MADPQPATEPARPRVFSGIRATGDKTLGNYSGGYRQYVATQAEGEAFFCIVDLHSITTPIEPAELREYTLAGAAMLVGTLGLFTALMFLFVRLLPILPAFELRRLLRARSMDERRTLPELSMLTSFETFLELRRRVGLPQREVTKTLQAAAHRLVR